MHELNTNSNGLQITHDPASGSQVTISVLSRHLRGGGGSFPQDFNFPPEKHAHDNVCWKTSSTTPSKSLVKTLQLPPSNLRNFIDYPPSKSLMKTLQLPPSNLRNFIDYPHRNYPPPPRNLSWKRSNYLLELTKLHRLPPARNASRKRSNYPPSNLRNFIDYPPSKLPPDMRFPPQSMESRINTESRFPLIIGFNISEDMRISKKP